MKKFLVLGIILFSLQNNSAFSQRKILGRFFGNENDSTSKGRFIILPALGYAQETGFEYGLVSLASFYTNKDTVTRNSSIAGLIAFTTKKQSIITLKPDIWSKQNRYHYIGDLRYRDFPFNFYGIGDDTHKADEERITQTLKKVSVEVEKLMKRGSYTGVNTSYENYKFIDKEPGGVYETDQFIHDKDGGAVLFLGVSQIIDSRNSNVYPSRGTYLKLNYSFAPDIFGGENFTGSTAKLDFRTFKSYNPKTVLGFNLAYQTIQGSTTPFYLLPQLGNDQVMRGYYTGRYRDRNLLATQIELKYRIIPRFGVVGFAGAGSVYNTRINLGNFKPSYGAGIRYFFDTIRGLSLRIDYAFGEKRSGEERQKGFYIAFGEAF
ncbi:BamA/TamA family outer membrane protein [Pedobacter sp. P351]|uniref:BamA/TamA family outer membrane protein n=1 Tax=Pedobacter superstes TaxID=3133441 RepID=UPI0030B6C012